MHEQQRPNILTSGYPVKVYFIKKRRWMGEYGIVYKILIKTDSYTNKVTVLKYLLRTHEGI
jgi:hypothetical protein